MTKFGYVRVSSLDQANSGLSIEVQKNNLKAIGIENENIYCDGGRSGGLHEDAIERQHKGRYLHIQIDLINRPELQKLLTISKKGDEIYFCRYDRISRSSRFMDTFYDLCKDKGVNLVSMTESPDPLVRKIITVFSEEELNKTVIRNASVFKGIFDKGFFPFKPPLGYQKNIKQLDGKLRFPDLPEGELVIDPEKIEFVKDIFHMMSEGIHYKKICEKYDISNRTIYDVVRNKTFLGMTHFGNEWKKTPHVPQIISDDIWQKANANIKGKTAIRS